MQEVYEPLHVSPGVLRRLLEEAKADGWRLVQAHACTLSDGYQLVYSVAKEYAVDHYEIHISADTEIESISDIFPSAQLYEQEMDELFGVKIIKQPTEPPIKLYHLPTDAPMK